MCHIDPAFPILKVHYNPPCAAGKNASQWQFFFIYWLGWSCSGQNPDLIYFGGTTQTKAGQLFKDMIKVGLTCPMMAPDGCYEKAMIESAGKDAFEKAKFYVTFGGVPPEQLVGPARSSWLSTRPSSAARRRRRMPPTGTTAAPEFLHVQCSRTPGLFVKQVKAMHVERRARCGARRWPCA